MRRAPVTSLTILSLAIWVLSGALGQLLWLHVGEEHGAHHSHEADPLSTAICDADHDHHDHEVPAGLTLPTLPGVRHHAHATPVAALIGLPRFGASLTAEPLAPDREPSARPLSPHRIAVLQI